MSLFILSQIKRQMLPAGDKKCHRTHTLKSNRCWVDAHVPPLGVFIGKHPKELLWHQQHHIEAACCSWYQSGWLECLRMKANSWRYMHVCSKHFIFQKTFSEVTPEISFESLPVLRSASNGIGVRNPGLGILNFGALWLLSYTHFSSTTTVFRGPMTLLYRSALFVETEFFPTQQSRKPGRIRLNETTVLCIIAASW